MAIMCSCIYWSSVRGFLMLSGIHVFRYIKAWFSHAADVAATELPVLPEKLLWEHIATGNKKHCRFLPPTWMWRKQILLQQETSQVFTAGWTWVNFVGSPLWRLGWTLLPVTSVLIGTVCIAGNTGSYVAGSLVAYEDYSAGLNKFKQSCILHCLSPDSYGVTLALLMSEEKTTHLKYG